MRDTRGFQQALSAPIPLVSYDYQLWAGFRCCVFNRHSTACSFFFLARCCESFRNDTYLLVFFENVTTGVISDLFNDGKIELRAASSEWKPQQNEHFKHDIKDRETQREREKERKRVPRSEKRGMAANLAAVACSIIGRRWESKARARAPPPRPRKTRACGARRETAPDRWRQQTCARKCARKLRESMSERHTTRTQFKMD